MTQIDYTTNRPSEAGPPDEPNWLEIEEVFEARFGHPPTQDELQGWLEGLDERR